MNFETVQIHFLSEVLVCCHPEILLLRQRNVTTSPLYYQKSNSGECPPTPPLSYHQYVLLT